VIIVHSTVDSQTDRRPDVDLTDGVRLLLAIP
jgi:hypothetical protein